MGKIGIISACLSFSFLIPIALYAGNVSIPNKFSEKTTASDSKVNENFEVLKDAVNVNSNEIALIKNKVNQYVSFRVMANGQEIGYLAGVEGSRLYAVSYEGYILQISRQDGKILEGHQFLFETADCTGTYYAYDIGDMTPGTLFYAVEPNSNGVKKIYFVPKDDVTKTRNVKSHYGHIRNNPETGIPEYGCTDFSSRSYETLLNSTNVLPNEPGITGFSSSLVNSEFSLQMPITIQGIGK